jgi:hypothetical protein
VGELEVRLFRSWFEQVAAADDPLEVWYEHIRRAGFQSSCD